MWMRSRVCATTHQIHPDVGHQSATTSHNQHLQSTTYTQHRYVTIEDKPCQSQLKTSRCGSTLGYAERRCRIDVTSTGKNDTVYNI